MEKRIRALSGGEKSRLVMARMLFDPPNFLVLDEPTNHLDLATKEMLVEALRDFEGTMLFVSHDRTFLRGLSNRVLELGGETGTEAEPHLYPGSLRRVRRADRPRGPRRPRLREAFRGHNPRVNRARWPVPIALACGFVGAACASPRSPRPVAAESRVEPLVLAHPQAPRDGRLAVAAIFPAVGRYALSGVQSLNGVRLAVLDSTRRRRAGTPGRAPRVPDRKLLPRRAPGGDPGRGRGSPRHRGLELERSLDGHRRGGGGARCRPGSNVSTAQDLTLDPATGRSRRFVFRVCSSDGVMGGLLAAFARGDLGARRAAVLYEVGRTYSTRLARSFVERFRDPGGSRVTAEFVYLALETDFRAQLRQVLAFAPDVLFLPGSFTDATLIARQAEEIGLHATLLGADAWSSPLLFKRGGPGRPAHFLDHCSPPTQLSTSATARCSARPTQGCRAALAYDAVRAIAAGLGSLGRLDSGDLEARLPATRRRLRDAVAAADFPGVTGRVRFDEGGGPAHGHGGDGRVAHDRRRLRDASRGLGRGPLSVDRLRRGLADLSLNAKVTATLIAAFVSIVGAFFLFMVPFLAEQRASLLEKDKRLLATLRDSHERDFIYDLLSENEESLAAHLADLAGQRGLLWARVESDGIDLAATADRDVIRDLLGDDALAFSTEPSLALLVRSGGVASLVGAGGGRS